MSFTRAVAYNTAIQTVGRFVSIIIGLVAVGLLTRGLGQEGYGQYTTVLSVLGFIAVIADLGLYLVLVREMAKKEHPDEYIVGNILGLRLAAASVLLVAGAAASPPLPLRGESWNLGRHVVVFFFRRRSIINGRLPNKVTHGARRECRSHWPHLFFQPYLVWPGASLGLGCVD